MLIGKDDRPMNKCASLICRWLATPLIAFLLSLGGVYTCMFLWSYMNRWCPWGLRDSYGICIIPEWFVLTLLSAVGATTAFIVVLATALVAPGQRRVVAIVTFVLGALLAKGFLLTFFGDDSLLLSFVITLAGGLLGLCTVELVGKSQR